MFKTLFQNNSQTNNPIIMQAIFLIALLVIGKADPMAVVFAYIFETIIIGCIHILKLFYIVKNNNSQEGSSKLMDYFSIPFFLIHYGAFVAIQSVIIYTAFAIKDDRFSTSLSFSNFLDIYNLEGFNLVALSIITSHLFSFYFHFLKIKKYKSQDLGLYFIKPYLRIFIQQFLAIVPMFFLFLTHSVGIIAAIMLILIRVFLDFYFIMISKNPEKITKLAKRILDKNKPEELPKIEKTLKVFFEE